MKMRPKTKNLKTKTSEVEKPGAWINRIVDGVGTMISIETTDGLHRAGKLTGVRNKEILIDGRVMEYPSALELNGDPSDNINFFSIRRITFG